MLRSFVPLLIAAVSASDVSGTGTVGQARHERRSRDRRHRRQPARVAVTVPVRLTRHGQNGLKNASTSSCGNVMLVGQSGRACAT